MRTLALLGNGLLLAGLVYMMIASPPNGLQAWSWLAASGGFVLINFLGLFAIAGRLFTVLALLVNGMALFAWGGLIALMLVWPMGNKPEGFELAGLLASWLVLVITEVALFQRVKGQVKTP